MIPETAYFAIIQKYENINLMIEKIIIVEDIEPVVFFGANNVNFDKIISFFPDIKLVARGNEIKIFADGKVIGGISEKINSIIEFCRRHNSFPDDLHSFFSVPWNNNHDAANVIIYNIQGKPVLAYSLNQKTLVEKSTDNDLLFVTGPAGSGKTYTAIALAVRALKNREVRRIILSRPAVEAGENLGYLPGDLKEKLDPYLQPLYDALRDMIPAKKLKEHFEDYTIEIAPLAFMRGRTLDNAFVILDEAQNATFMQIKMFLTRMGRNSKFIVTGDLTQVDLPKSQNSGLVSAIRILENIEGISHVVFDENDIVRHKLVRSIVKAYENINNK